MGSEIQRRTRSFSPATIKYGEVSKGIRKVSIVADDDHKSAECLDNAGVKFELYLQN